MEDYLEKDEFMSLGNKEVAEIVRKMEKPRVLCFIPDGTRKKNIIVDGIDPKTQLIEYNTSSRQDHNSFIELLRTFFDHGIKTLVLPIMKRENILRNPEYQKALINNALRLILTSDIWLDFYKEYEIRLKFFGDIEYLSKPGFPQLLDWIISAEKNTGENKKHYIYFGLAYAQSIEEVRLTKMAIDIYNKTGNVPTREELIRYYFGDYIEPVDIMMRPSVIRDSDMQPVLISGQSEMYFPVTSVQLITEKMFREILYDYLYQRMITHGRKDYSDGVSSDELKYMKKYFEMNKNSVIGLGRRMRGGHFWYPVPQIQLPDNETG